MDMNHIHAGLAGPFEDTAYAAPSGELFLRLDLQAAAEALTRLAPLAGALITGIALLLLMLALSSLASLADRRARRIAGRRATHPRTTPPWGMAASRPAQASRTARPRLTLEGS